MSTSELVLFNRLVSETPAPVDTTIILVKRPLTFFRTVACNVNVTLSPAARFRPVQTPLAGFRLPWFGTKL